MNRKRGRLPEPDERETPPELFAELHAKHRFTLDGAASLDNAKLLRYNTKTGGCVDEGQETFHVPLFSWENERVWCNPPYSDIAPWIARAWSSEAQIAYLLVPNWTDRKWWLELVEPYRDGHDLAEEAPMNLRTEFLCRQRFLYKGLPIRTEDGKIGQPEFGLVGLIFTRKEQA